VGILGFVILGLVAGAIAKALHKGEEPGGILGTFVTGILGAVIGGLVASALGIGSLSSFFSLGTWLIAIGGALLLLVAYSAVTSRGRGDRRSANAI
jgi:uncharacterized membrane protein YeaQ/YmgE (transglycosylase-associated protein family)